MLKMLKMAKMLKVYQDAENAQCTTRDRRRCQENARNDKGFASTNPRMPDPTRDRRRVPKRRVPDPTRDRRRCQGLQNAYKVYQDAESAQSTTRGRRLR